MNSLPRKMTKEASSKVVSRRPCPVCGNAMERQTVLDAEVDVCEAHGVWLDIGELEQIAERVYRKGVFSTKGTIKGAVKKAKTSGKISGWLLGPLAFLFD
jgi:Zn-finger nucleic acid-binding protein